MIGLRKIDTIDCSKLLSLDLDNMTWLPVFMVSAVVLNISVYWDPQAFGGLSRLFVGSTVLSFVVMLFLCLRRGTMSRFVAFSILMVLVLLATSIISKNDIRRACIDGCSVAFIAMVCDYFKDRYKVVIYAFAFAFSLCAYMNFIHMLTHPELWIVTEYKSGATYLLGGNYNQMGSRLICAICTSILCMKYSRWWIVNAFGVTVVSILPLAIVGSMTSLTGIFLFLIFCFIPSNNFIKLGIIALIGLVILFQIFICFQGKGLEGNPLAVFIIQDILNKDMTFTYRTDMWENAKQLFFDSPIFGYGVVDGDWYNIHLSSWAKGPHNTIWDILINGGVILLSIYTYINYLVFSKLPSTHDKFSLIIFAAITSLNLMMVMEVYPLILIFSLLSLAYHSNHTACPPQGANNNHNE